MSKEQHNNRGIAEILTSPLMIDKAGYQEVLLAISMKDDNLGTLYSWREDDLKFKGSTAIVKLDGVMWSGQTERTLYQLEEAQKNEEVEQIVLHVNSGGGVAGSSNCIIDFLQQKDRKPVTCIFDRCASEAVNVAIFCDKIYASNNRTAKFGSIGAYITNVDWSKHYEQIGIKLEDIYSSLSPDKNKESRELEKGNDKEVIKMLDDLVVNFIDTVKKQRPKATEEEIYKGGMFSADKAKELKLIDGTKSIRQFLNNVEEPQKTETINNLFMTLKELKQESPELYQEVLAQGQREEMERVNSWLAHFNSDQDTVIQGIKEGKEITASVREELLVKAAAKGRVAIEENAEATGDVVADDKETAEQKAKKKELEEIVKAGVKELKQKNNIN